ncbi:MAG: amidohydrolase [Solobacterium sp.]|nr:amidohydrolase [Solobacterium sp.]
MRAFINCRIYKNEDTAFLIDENEIIETGSDAEILSHISKNIEVTDLGGMLVMPGFVDSHMHLVSLGKLLDSVRLDGMTSMKDIQAAIAKKGASAREGEWIEARGYNEERFTDGLKPSRQLLDEACTSHPVIVTRACGHIAVINSKAIEEAGLSEETAVEGGRFDLKTGLLEENAISYVRSKIPYPDEKTLTSYLEAAMDYCNSHGITCVGSDDFLSATENYKDILNLYEKLSYQGRMNVRVNEQCQFNSPKEFAGFLDEGYTTDVGNDFFRIGPLKLITDGSLGGRTAALRHPYTDKPDTAGMMIMDEEEIETFVLLANRFNMPTIAHAIGDKAVETMLEVYKDNVYEGNPLHHGLVHCQIMSQAQREQIIKMKLSCYIQPQFIDADAEFLESRVGKNRAQSSYPFRSLFEGTLVSGGSDAPVEMPDPLAAIRMAITRTSMHSEAKMNQDECLTNAQAIELMCDKGYEQLFMNDRFGKIAKGFTADFTVIDQDIREMKPEDITSAKIMMTVIDGRTVFER